MLSQFCSFSRFALRKIYSFPQLVVIQTKLKVLIGLQCLLSRGLSQKAADMIAKGRHPYHRSFSPSLHILGNNCSKFGDIAPYLCLHASCTLMLQQWLPTFTFAWKTLGEKKKVETNESFAVYWWSHTKSGSEQLWFGGREAINSRLLKKWMKTHTDFQSFSPLVINIHTVSLEHIAQRQ